MKISNVLFTSCKTSYHDCKIPNNMVKQTLIIGLVGHCKDQFGRYTGSNSAGKDEFAKIARHFFGSSTISFEDEAKSILSPVYRLNSKNCTGNTTTPVYAGKTWRQLHESFAYNPIFGQCSETWTNKLRRQLDRLKLSPLERLTVDLFGLEPSHPIFETICSHVQGSIDSSDLPLLPVSDSLEIVVVTDVRFFNEYDMLIKNGAIMVEIRRTIPDSKRGKHVPESHDVRMKPTVIIENSGSLESFYSKVESVLTGIHTSFEYNK